MAHKTLTIDERVHRLLLKHKAPGESYNELLLRLLPPPPARTTRELLRKLKALPPESFPSLDVLDEAMDEQLRHVPG